MLRRGRPAPGLALALAALTAALGLALPAACRSGRSAPVLAASDFESGDAAGWAPDDPSRWRVVYDAGRGSKVYALTAPGAPGPVRAPTSVSVLAGHDVGGFELTGRLRCAADPAVVFRDMCVIFHYRDPTHFAYVHFAGTSDAVHNIIGLVNGADRVKINLEPTGAPAARLTDLAWHAFKVTCDAATGEIRAYLDDLTTPLLTARVGGPAHGLVGVGSFDDTGAFDDLVLRAPGGGDPAGRS
ncbi:MAG TPA: hypothetical protein P5119_12235 [Candidatus Aminicenantes bacterium]|nr:hypothetical protein [Candidatus Aminicenantes bacterium]HRY66093.1 hypothetical protein [Candidatus Aminicenantes bacterium]HRZ72858.1 hypothetical protein [Candidatus Aminicenantes bacterium]